MGSMASETECRGEEGEGGVQEEENGGERENESDADGLSRQVQGTSHFRDEQ